MIIKLKCNNCGAEDDYSSDIIATKCKYCGSPILNIPKKYLNMIRCPQAITKDESFSKIRKFLLDKVGEEASIQNLIPFTLPIWRGNVKGTFHYEGYRKHTVTKTVKSGKETHVVTETYYIPVDKTLDIDEKVSTPGRLNEDILALDEILDNSLIINKYSEISELVEKGWELTLPEISSEEAKNRLDDKLEEILYEKAKEEVDELLNYEASLRTYKIDLIYYPVIEFTYLYKNKRFRGVLDPVQGKVIRCEIPLTKSKRLIYTILSYGVLAIVSILTPNYIHATNIGPIPIIIGLAAGGIGSYTLIRATASQEVYD